MTYDSPEIIAVNLLKQAVESKGCHLDEVDIENMVIKVNGPDDVVRPVHFKNHIFNKIGRAHV